MGLPRSADALGRRISSLDFWGYIGKIPNVSLMSIGKQSVSKI
jgi:hypothetical protein